VVAFNRICDVVDLHVHVLGGLKRDALSEAQVASTVGSLGGNVNLRASGKYTQIASNVVTAQDVNITAAEIELLTANETGYNSHSDKDLKIGTFARIKSPFIDLINNVDSAAGPRPSSFRVEYSVDGSGPVVRNFNNSPGGT
jgi:hypothetical protein